MKAILYRRYGPAGVLEFSEMPQPTITDRQILVKVHAASVNPVDWKLRSGRPRTPWIPFPRVPGSDVAGEVVRAGRAVKRFKPGDPVFAMLSPFSGGGCAEYAAVPDKNASLKPRNLSFVEAAAVPLAALMALQSLRDHGKIKSGDRVLVNGASGGVGSFAVQIAKACGAVVTAVTSGKNIEFVKNLGADRVIDYTREEFARSDARFDIVFDVVSNRSFRECKPVLKPQGIYVTTSVSLSAVLQIFIPPFLREKQARMAGVRARADDLALLAEWIEAGKIRPYVEKVLPLSKTAEAHALSESGRVRGKLVIRAAD